MCGFLPSQGNGSPSSYSARGWQKRKCSLVISPFFLYRITIQGHHWQSFSQVFQQTYNDILGMSLGKPLMIAETASAEGGGEKAGWITDALLTQLPVSFPEVKAI